MANVCQAISSRIKTIYGCIMPHRRTVLVPSYGWMPIDTAPVKGNPILCWHPIMGATKVYPSKHTRDGGFTHWTFIPEAPVADATGGR